MGWKAYCMAFSIPSRTELDQNSIASQQAKWHSGEYHSHLSWLVFFPAVATDSTQLHAWTKDKPCTLLASILADWASSPSSEEDEEHYTQKTRVPLSSRPHIYYGTLAAFPSSSSFFKFYLTSFYMWYYSGLTIIMLTTCITKLHQKRFMLKNNNTHTHK